MRDFIVKKVPAILGLAVYAAGFIGSTIFLCVNGAWPWALTLVPTFVFGAPVVVDCIKELLKKD